MTKKLFVCFMAFVIFVAVPNLVVAQNVYVNSKGVAMDMESYKKLCSIFSEDYIELIENDELQKILSSGLDNIVVKEIYDFAVTRDSYHETSNKSLRIIKSGTTITLMAKWINEPKIKTYDVIGVRFGSGVSLKGNISFKQIYKDSSGNNIEITNHYDRVLSNGFGCSFKVGNGTDYNISIQFDYSGSGIVYGSYQHAKSSSTLAESQKYTISSSGYGGVFTFDSSVKDKYDAMGGVDLKI